MPKIHLIIGPVGAGKSTLAHRLARENRAPILNLDEWMTQLFRPDRPDEGVMNWYAERSERCLAQIWRLTCQWLELGSDVVLEIGLIQRGKRHDFYERIDAAGHEMQVYLVDAEREVRRQRVERRNIEQGSTFSMVVPPEIFELASNLWEAPDLHEIESRSIDETHAHARQRTGR
jgi:predicted kinase